MHITAEDRAVLDFERLWWKYPGAKDAEIMERFGLTATRYYQRLNALIDEPARRGPRRAARTPAASAARATAPGAP